MQGLISSRKTIFNLTGFLFLSLFCQRHAYALSNYDHHPDLAKAMEFDSETNRGDKEKADRSKAEYHYLHYLEDVNETFQQARVYCQLGAMYAVSYNKEKGEERDPNKARFYYRKVLEAEPNRIGRPTIVARNMLSCFDNPDFYDRVKARVEMYKWLSTIDEKSINGKWLPLRTSGREVRLRKVLKDPNSPNGYRIETSTRIEPHDNNHPPPNRVKGLKNLVKSLKYTVIYNAAYDAEAMDNPEKGLNYILENLPPDAPERRSVEEVIKKSVNPVVNEGLRELLDAIVIEDVNDQNGISSVQKGTIARRRFIPNVAQTTKPGQPFVFDLEEGKLVETKLPYDLDMEHVYNKLVSLGKGDIAWDGSLLTTRNAKLFSVIKESHRPLLKQKEKKYTGKYKMPVFLKYELPYAFLATNKERSYFMVNIVEIKPEGIIIIYTKFTEKQASKHKLKEETTKE